MNKAALQKHDIYNKLAVLGEQELGAVADYIDFMQHKKQRPTRKKFMKLEGILKGYDIDLADIKKMRQEAWKHVDEEAAGE